MKFIPSVLSYVISSRPSRRNFLLLGRFLGIFAVMVVIYSVIFHYIMAAEGQSFSWVTGFYWTLTVMSTLGFGDITFSSDLGRIFSIFVLLSGVLYLLVLLPFSFIEFFYAPWMKAQAAARAPRALPSNWHSHVILTHLDPVTESLIKKLVQYRYRYALIVSDLTEALRLYDEGIKVVYGELDDLETYGNCRVDDASLVVSTAGDEVNTNVAFTVRELSRDVPIFTTANREESVDVLELAGSSRVVRLGDMMGQALARQTIGGDAMAHPIGEFDNLIIAEAVAAGTPLVGKTAASAGLREQCGVTIVGIWRRGKFEAGLAGTTITSDTVLILAGTEEQIAGYNALFCIYHQSAAPVVVLGAGRVGRAVARCLESRGMDYRVVEERAERIRNTGKYIHGSGAELAILKKAGIMEAPSVVITPHDDDLNIYLTIYCRQLRPDIQILTRCALERNVSTIHRAGADFVMSYASMGANTIINMLRRSDILLLAEGLDVFRVRTPKVLVGATLREAELRNLTGCNVVALVGQGGVLPNPDPDVPLEADGEMILIGSFDAEKEFLAKYHTERIDALDSRLSVRRS